MRRLVRDNWAMKILPPLFIAIAIAMFFAVSVQAADLPPESPLWATTPARHAIRYDRPEQVRAPDPPPGSPSGQNRVFSYISTPTYSIHRPDKPNGVGLVICPGGGYRDVWLDREGHDLAIWLKAHGVTSLVLKYRTNSGDDNTQTYSWADYLPAVQADARQAIRILRRDAVKFGLQPNKIGICGFSAGGNLALISALDLEAERPNAELSGMPDFAGLFYPWFREDYSQIVNSRMASESTAGEICPMFLMNASDDRATPASKCVDFYALLLEAGVKAELHVFGKGSHGFDLGTGRGESAATWPISFVAWLRDSQLIEE